MAHQPHHYLFDIFARGFLPMVMVGFCAVSWSSWAGAEQAAPIAGLSDVELTDLAADWDQLDAVAKADLIAETRERMQPGQQAQPGQSGRSRSVIAAPSNTPHSSSNSVGQFGSKSSSSVEGRQSGPASQLTLRTERRRYGRVVRQSDGSLVRIETQVVTVQRRDPKRAFGVGFERRHSQDDQAQQRPVTAEIAGPFLTERAPERTPNSVPADSPRPDVLVVSDPLD